MTAVARVAALRRIITELALSTDAQLAKRAAKYADLPGATTLRHLANAEFEYRLAVRQHALTGGTR